MWFCPWASFERNILSLLWNVLNRSRMEVDFLKLCPGRLDIQYSVSAKQIRGSPPILCMYLIRVTNWNTTQANWTHFKWTKQTVLSKKFEEDEQTIKYVTVLRQEVECCATGNDISGCEAQTISYSQPIRVQVGRHRLLTSRS